MLNFDLLTLGNHLHRMDYGELAVSEDWKKGKEENGFE